MALEKCLECGKEISSYVNICPHCSFPQIEFKDSISYKYYPQDANFIDVAFGLLTFKYDYDYAPQLLGDDPFFMDAELISKIQKYYNKLGNEVESVFEILYPENSVSSKYGLEKFATIAQKMYENGQLRCSSILASIVLKLDNKNQDAPIIEIKRKIEQASSLDELFPDVARFVVEQRSCSANSIQRNFGFGFNRAQNIINSLIDTGIVLDAQEKHVKEVRVSLYELEEVLKDILSFKNLDALKE